MKKISTRDLVIIPFFSILIAVCSWLSIPAAVAFTMQTFAVYLTLLILGGKKGMISVTIYILLGAVGIPVFSNMTGGVGILLGVTGGYILGFLLMCPVYGIAQRLFGKKIMVSIIALVIGLLVCYAFGTAWFMHAYAKGTGPIGIGTALSWCVIPFIIPDLGKLLLALFIYSRLKPFIKSFTN